MSKFIWITSTYRINIDSIFSLQEVNMGINPLWEEWNENYNEISDKIWPNDIKEIKIDSEIYNINDIIEDDETYDKIKEIIHQKIIEKIGEEPQKYIYEYHCITTTGINVILSKEKYNLINEYIDENCGE